jgi:hypothetical protein
MRFSKACAASSAHGPSNVSKVGHGRGAIKSNQPQCSILTVTSIPLLSSRSFGFHCPPSNYQAKSLLSELVTESAQAEYQHKSGLIHHEAQLNPVSVGCRF